MATTKNIKWVSRLATALLFLFLKVVIAGGVSGRVMSTSQTPVKASKVLVGGTEIVVYTDASGRFEIDSIPAGSYTIEIQHKDYQSTVHPVSIGSGTNIQELLITLWDKETDLTTVHVKVNNPIGPGADLGKDINTTGKIKYEVRINPEKTTSGPLHRIIPAPVPIIEYDGAGLQLGIGGRGLNPKRTAHYNTRQNGYDISADALGYPETYYTPPVEAIKKITLLRGAASLQFGPQFGGMINFQLKEGPQDPNKKYEIVSANKYGSFNQFHSFNSIATGHKKLRTYSFYQLKTGDGWRDNSAYTSHTGYFGLDYLPTDGLNIKLQLTHHQYVAQQPGGLTDNQFYENAQQSFRERNWFNVNWNIASLIFNYNMTDDFWINSKTFMVHASRNSVGFLQAPNLIDPGTERTLITGDFQNIGNETRIVNRYKFHEDKKAALIAGIRLYKGWAQTGQGVADNTDQPNFEYLNNTSPENSQYTFPSKNLSVFAENSFHLAEKLSITPGVRYEHISTESDGYFNRYLIGLNGDTLDVLNSTNSSKSDRNIYLGGVGVTYNTGKYGKFITNFSQNFRSVNFSDINIVIPNFRVDDNIKDETGHNFDLGYNKSWRNKAFIGVTGYYLYYANRIGMIWETDPETFDTYQIRTNVSASRTIGI